MTTRTRFSIVVVGAFACAPAARGGAAAQDLISAQEVADAELAFAHDALSLGMRDSFLAHIADDGVLFRPRAVAGRAALQKDEKRPGLLAWEPVFADIARSGDLGVTTGPWTFRPSATDSITGYGQFATVWRKHSDGRWHFIVDMGTSNPPPNDKPVLEVRRNPVQAVTRIDSVAARGALSTADEHFSSVMAVGVAPGGLLHPDIRVLREGAHPTLGAAAEDRLTQPGASFSAKQLGMGVSAAGDLGYTYGEYQSGRGAEVEQGNYLRLWRRVNGAWLLLLDMHMQVGG
jgi:ketosteroid isomerase-like protein